MKRTMQGLLWLFLLEFALLVMSLEPGFLDFDNLPDTNFSCVGKVIGGYYADLETNCQMFHVCTIGQLDEPMDIRFLCLNGTVFDQETRVCERIDEVDCTKSEQFYSLNLELYGNTQPPILEESPEIDYSSESKKSSTTVPQTSTVTTSTFAPFFTTSPATTNRDISKVITSHHFPINSPDIRFNPEEININLKLGAPPDFTRSQVPVSYQQQTFSEKNTRVTVTTHTTIYKNEKHNRVPLLSTTNQPLSLLEKAETTLTPKSVVSYGLTHNQGSQAASPTEINYGFSYQQTEDSSEYHTEIPPHPYQYQLNIANFRPPTAEGHPYHSTYRASNKRPYKSNFPPTTYRNHPAFTSSSKSPSYQNRQTEKPPHLQLPLPLLPTLPPLTFSSPSPFSVGHHIETKRYTKDHQSPPRIIISASASVSDNSGRRLNYSLGTIGASHLLGTAPSSYDDYKEEDVISDPFYLDVPKIKQTRRKRDVSEEVIKNDQEAEDLLRYLFNWYKNRENKAKQISFPVSADDITQINDQLAPISEVETNTKLNTMYERMFRRILNESRTGRSEEAKTEDKDVSGTTNTDIFTTLPILNENDEDSATTVITTTEVITPNTKKQNRNRGLFSIPNETIKNKDEDQINIKLPSKNHSRRSGRLSSNTEYVFNDRKVQNNLFTRDQSQRFFRRQMDKIAEFESNSNVERKFETSSTEGSTERQDVSTTLVGSTETIPTTVETNFDYELNSFEEENASETTLVDPTTTEAITTKLEEPAQEYEFENADNLYDDINYDSSTLNPSPTDSTTTNDLLTETTFVTAKEIIDTTTILPEILQSETQSLSHKEWNKVVNYENSLTNRNMRNQFNDNKILTVTAPNEIKLEKETAILTIPDYVDDNYEPLTYQIDPPVKEYDKIITEKDVETTTNTVPTVTVIDNGENSTETVVDYTMTSTDNNLPTTFLTTESTEFTTTPTVTTDNAETTLVTEGMVAESTTVVTTENHSETNLPSTFITDTPNATETYLITEPTQFTTIPSTTTTTEKERKKEYNRHRFSSFNRKRGRGQSKFKSESLSIPNNTVSALEEQKNITNTNMHIIQNSSSTIAITDKVLEKTEVSLTDAPLLKSANPTKSKYTKIILSTTPLTKAVRIDVRKETNDRRFVFNCFNKKIHQFYSDPRDCRLFHYCTLGYTKNQLVDMKFVCDLGTYYDEEKFICTKMKPARCS